LPPESDRCPCDDLERYHEVIEPASGCPVLVRGGGRVSNEEVMRRIIAVLEQGASGIVYGRNIIQHENPERVTLALMAVVHQDVTAEDGIQILTY
jgi:class I fructose-bisphosphate aldolase